MTLNVTAASDIFTQDVEDLPEGFEGQDAGGGDAARTHVEQPSGKAEPKKDEAKAESAGAAKQDQSGKPLQAGQIRILEARMKGAGVTPENVTAKFGKPLPELLFEQFTEIQSWIAEQAK